MATHILVTPDVLDFPVVVQAVIGTRFLVVYPIGPAV
jgi:hypothetical protein